MSDRFLDYIREHHDEHGYPPSIRDLAEAMGCSVSNAYYHLLRLEGEGLITRTPGVARSVRITGSVMKAPKETM